MQLEKNQHTRQLIIDSVAKTLLSAGYEEKQFNEVVASTLNITASSAYRKMSGDSGFSDSDIDALANFLGVSQRHLLQGGGKSCFAKIKIDEKLYSCHVTVGAAVQEGNYSDFILIGSEAKYVIPYDEDNVHEGALCVTKIEIIPSTQPPPYIAILEDDVGALSASVDILSAQGFKVSQFTDQDELRKSISNQKYDIIALDWWMRGETVEKLIGDIRRSDSCSNATIAVITGELRAKGHAKEDVLVNLTERFKTKTYLKPINWALLAAEWLAFRSQSV